MNTIRICPGCNNTLPPDAPSGLCPVCLLKTDPDAKTAAQRPAGEPTSTLTISPEAFVRVHYFGDYELQEEIARGGMGVVWKARQASLNRTVAVKMILAGKLAGDAEVQRFRREAEAAANLQHPNIVAIHEVGQHDGQHYYSMDFVEGRDLGALVRENGPLPPARAAECLQTIAEAVHFAHQRGTLHRDLKPQNVLMDAAGVPRITDFGLAKFVERDDNLTQTGAAMGSPSYMPPEQAAGHLDQVGPHSDVYALGAILYELLTGRPPFRAETPVATMRQVLESDPAAPRKINPAVPPDLETICLKCLEKNPARRYPSARALAEDLGRFLKHEPVQATPVSSLRKAESWVRRHPWTLLAAGSLVVMVLAGLLYWQYERVKFLEERPLLTDKLIGRPGAQKAELGPWYHINFFMYLISLTAMRVFTKFAQGIKSWKQLFDPPTNLEPKRPVSHSLRVICGVIGLIGFGCAMMYFANTIHASVWGESQGWIPWAVVYANCYFSLALLSPVVRDYLAFIHGAPGRTLSAEQNESLHQAIFDGRIPAAIKLYRRAFPDLSLAEAREFVGRLSVELRAKQPEKFAPPPRMWDLNWKAMGLCVVVELAVLAGLWMLPVGPAASALRLESCAVGFLFGASLLLAFRLKGAWQKRLAVMAIMMCFPFLLSATLRSSSKETFFFFGGIAFGAGMIVSGATRKWRKPAQGQRPLNDLSSRP